MAAQYQHISHGFDPIYDERSRVLVLGSFPSVKSRQNEFYYGNPQNRFWRVIAGCEGCAEPESIPQKREMLLSHGIAQANDIARILAAAPVRAVICNGATAGRLYHKFLEYRSGIPAIALPSTSPANAAWDVERLT